jgi:hypothetical protein
MVTINGSFDNERVFFALRPRGIHYLFQIVAIGDHLICLHRDGDPGVLWDSFK